MKKLLPCTALVMCAGMACAQAEEKNDWHFNIGAMYEIENVEGYGEDMDGLAEPSVYFNAANGPWRISLAYYQEGPVDYSAGKRGRGLIARSWRYIISSSKAMISVSV